MFTRFYIKSVQHIKTHEGGVNTYATEYVQFQKFIEHGKVWGYPSIEQHVDSFATEKDALDAIANLPTVENVSFGKIFHRYEVEAVEYDFANFHGYSDIMPFEIVRVISDKTIEIREMDAEQGDWKPVILQGGFAGHYENQHDQVWNIKSNETNPVIRARLNKDKKGREYWKSSYGNH